jgi:hypothetical protein
MRRSDFTAVTPQIGKTQIVGDDQDDVGSQLGGGAGA